MRWPVQPRCWMGCIPHNALPSHQRLLICPFLRIRGKVGMGCIQRNALPSHQRLLICPFLRVRGKVGMGCIQRSHPTSVCLSAPSSTCGGRLGWVAFSAPISPASAYLPLPPRAGEGGMGCIQRNALPSHQRLLICPFLRVRGKVGMGDSAQRIKAAQTTVANHQLAEIKA